MAADDLPGLFPLDALPIEALYARALDSLSLEQRRRLAAEDRISRLLALLHQALAYVPPALADALEDELGGRHG